MSEDEGERPELGPETMEQRVRAVLETHWTTAGYTAPNASIYPWQWLWDSCFHAVIWRELGRDDRAVTELTEALSTQTESGFVPHINYRLDPNASVELWGRRGTSSITQPPMYGHAVAVLIESGVEVPPELIDRAARGLRFLLEKRHRDPESGLVLLCHPWESGADDCPRWDGAAGDSEWNVQRWRAFKSELVASITSDTTGGAVANDAFGVASVGFNALVAWNAKRLAEATGSRAIAAGVDELIASVDQRWSESLGTWVDAGTTATGSGRVRTTYALLPLLVTGRTDAVDAAITQLEDPAAFGGRFGPAGAHRAEPAYEENTYWRGPVWPQIAYLLWLALRRLGRAAAAEQLAANTMRGASASNLAEYWNADDGTGLGAVPQSWTGLALVMKNAKEPSR